MHGHTVVSKPPLGESGLIVCECGEKFDRTGEWADHYRRETPPAPTCDDPSHGRPVAVEVMAERALRKGYDLDPQDVLDALNRAAEVETCRYGTHAPRDCPARVYALGGTTPPACPVPLSRPVGDESDG